MKKRIRESCWLRQSSSSSTPKTLTMSLRARISKINRQLDKLRYDATYTKKNLSITHFRFDDMIRSIGRGQCFRMVIMMIIVFVLCVVIILV